MEKTKQTRFPINEEIARQLEEMAELRTASYYSREAYKKSAKIVRSLNFPIQSDSDVDNLKIQVEGIGAKTASKIKEILKSGQIQELAERPLSDRDRTKIIKEFKTIHGVNSVTAEDWFNSGYRSFQDLVQLYNQGGMTAAQRLGFFYYNDIHQKIPRREIDLLNVIFHKLLDPYRIKFEITGSYRRMLPESGDIDVLVQTVNQEGNRINMDFLIQILINAGLIIGNFTPKAEVKFMGLVRIPSTQEGHTNPVRRLDIRLIEPKSWPYALLYFTGSKDFNVKMRNHALSMGLSLSEYGLVLDNNKAPYPPENQPQPQTEEDVFKILRMKYLTPKERTSQVQVILTDGTTLSVEKSKNPPIDGKWYRPSDTLLIYINGLLFSVLSSIKGMRKVAGFDMDGTLINYKNGSKFSYNASEVQLMPGRIEKLRNAINLGFIPVIFTNQKSPSDKQKDMTFRKLVKVVEI